MGTATKSKSSTLKTRERTTNKSKPDGKRKNIDREEEEVLDDENENSEDGDESDEDGDVGTVELPDENENDNEEDGTVLAASDAEEAPQEEQQPARRGRPKGPRKTNNKAANANAGSGGLLGDLLAAGGLIREIGERHNKTPSSILEALSRIVDAVVGLVGPDKTE